MEIKIYNCHICGKRGEGSPYPDGWHKVNDWDVCKDCSGEDSGLSLAISRLKVKKEKRDAANKKG